MTTAQLNTLRQQALELNEVERARLASDLVASLDGPADRDAQNAWDTEICRRINEIELGVAEISDLDAAIAKARSRINS